MSLCALLLAAVACNPARREARSLLAAVDRFRAAPTEQQPELADAIAQVGCTDDEVCAARDACVKSASDTARAVRKRRAVERVLAEVLDGSLRRTDPRATSAPGELDESDRLLREGMDGLPACDEKLMALRIKWR